MNIKSFYGIFLILFISLLSACGGGDDGGSGIQSDEFPFELGLDGPGDPDNYFPLSPGNFWQYQVTETSYLGIIDYQSTSHIVSTKLISGITAFVLNESDTHSLDLTETYLFEDPNGIANLGTNDVDPFSASLSNYWEVRYPIVPGFSFVQIDRYGINFGQDLDLDNINETVDVRSVVTILGYESITTPMDTYDNAIHLSRKTDMNLHMSSDQSQVTATMNEDIYNVANIGSVDKKSEILLLGETETTHQALVAYIVDGSSAGITNVSGSVFGKVGSVGGTYEYFLFNVTTGYTYSVALTGLTGNADLIPLSPYACSQSHVLLDGTSPEDCRITATTDQIIVAVNTITNTDYILSIAPSYSITTPVNETAVIAVDNPTLGQVETRGESFYSATGLPLGAHNVSITGLSDDADLHVYQDGTYSFELDCTLRAAGDVLNYPEDCTVSNTTAVYFKVSSGELNRDGASYNILIH